MTSPRTRTEVWMGLLDAGRLNRYYTQLAGRYRAKSNAVELGLAFSALGGFARLVGLLPAQWEWIGDLGSAAVIALLVMHLSARLPYKAAALSAISLRCAELEREWADLWNDVDTPDPDEGEILRRAQKLASSLLAATSASRHIGVKEDEGLNQKAAEEAYRVILDRYGMELSAHG